MQPSYTEAVPQKGRILGELQQSRRELLAVLAQIPPERWSAKQHSGHEGWSPAEIAHHLLLAANQFLAGGKKVTSMGAKARRLGVVRRTLSAPIALVRYPFMKAKAPAPVRPTGGKKEEALFQLAQAWKATDQFIETCSEEDLKTLGMRHPLFGWTPMGKMFRMMAAHELRHTAQLRRSLSEKPV